MVKRYKAEIESGPINTQPKKQKYIERKMNTEQKWGYDATKKRDCN